MPIDAKQTPEVEPVLQSSPDLDLELAQSPDAPNSYKGAAYEISSERPLSPELQTDLSIGRLGSAAISAAAVYAALKGHLPPHSVAEADIPHQEMSFGFSAGTLALSGLQKKFAQHRLNRLSKVEAKIEKKEKAMKEDAEVGGAVAHAIYHSKDVIPEHEPVTAEQVDILRRTDKRKTKIINAALEVKRLQTLWGATEDNIVNEPQVRPGEEGTVASHTTRFGLGAKDSEAEEPNIFNNWGEGRESFYRVSRTVPDLGTDDFRRRLDGERRTPEERRKSIKADAKVWDLQTKIENERKKIFEDIEGRNPKLNKREVKLNSLKEKRDSLKRKVKP